MAAVEYSNLTFLSFALHVVKVSNMVRRTIFRIQARVAHILRVVDLMFSVLLSQDANVREITLS